jgi:hypothetical protein
MNTDPKLTREERLLYQEYMIADKRYPRKSTQRVTLVPTMSYDSEIVTFKGTENWTSLGIGSLVWLSKKNTLRPVRYNMCDCDIMLVLDENSLNNGAKQLRITGKRFGLITLDLINDTEFAWQWKFYPTKTGDKILVKPDTNPNRNTEYKILRNFTMEEKMAEFFRSQKQY